MEEQSLMFQSPEKCFPIKARWAELPPWFSVAMPAQTLFPKRGTLTFYKLLQLCSTVSLVEIREENRKLTIRGMCCFLQNIKKYSITISVIQNLLAHKDFFVAFDRALAFKKEGSLANCHSVMLPSTFFPLIIAVRCFPARFVLYCFFSGDATLLVGSVTKKGWSFCAISSSFAGVHMWSGCGDLQPLLLVLSGKQALFYSYSFLSTKRDWHTTGCGGFL